MITVNKPLLTIAIPTFCRSNYLKLCLDQFIADKHLFDNGHVELIILDNCSTDDTADVINSYQKKGLILRYIQHEKNIGSDANFAQCFNQALGHYVQILGDDDLYLPGMLVRLVNQLSKGEYGVVIIKSYGYERDFRIEHPGGGGGCQEFQHLDSYLYEVGQLITFISSCIINKKIQLDVDARVHCGSNLVQVHLVMVAILRAKINLFLTDYYLACKRANSGGYDFSQVFVENLFKIVNYYKKFGLSEKAIDALARKMLFVYYPFSLLRLRIENTANLEETRRRFREEFGFRSAYLFWNAPILYLPRPLAIIWGLAAVFVGRSANGELKRGIFFAFNRLRRHMAWSS
jgi:abequosyltransferase